MQLGAGQEDVERNLADMTHEGFLCQSGRGYMVSNSTKKG